MKTISLTSLLVLSSFISLTGCATWRVNSTSEELWEKGHYEEALKVLEAGAKDQPEQAELRSRYLQNKNKLFDLWTDQLNIHIQKQQWKEAQDLLDRALAFDPGNLKFNQAQLQVQRDEQAHNRYLEAKKLAENNPVAALRSVDEALRDAPGYSFLIQLKRELEQRLREKEAQSRLRQHKAIRVNIEFKDAPVRMVLEAISRSHQVQFNIDRDVKSDQRVSIRAKNQPLDEVLEWLSHSAQLGIRAINATVWEVYPNTDEKRRLHEELVLKTYTLAHAEAKTMAANLKSMFGLKDMIVDERLNVLVLREPADTIRLVDNVIQQLDQLEPEVLLEVEILEISRNRLLQLGIQPPTKIALTPITPSSGAFTLNELLHLKSNQISATIGGAAVNFNHTLNDADTLASPRLRVKNHGKASIMIGDKIPTVTTTFGGGVSGFVSETVNYTDVGVKFNIDSVQIAKDEHVQLKMKMEVSNIVNQITTQNGTIAYQLGTRNAETELVIRDGETQILAGLISNNESTSGNRLPLVGDIPFLGRLFGTTTDNHQKSEIVLAITPHIVRNLPVQTDSESEILSGTQQHARFKKPYVSVVEEAAPTSSSSTPELITDPAKIPDDSDDSKRTKGITRRAPKTIELYWQDLPKTAKVGQELSLQLKLKADGGIRGVPCQLILDPKQWKIEQVEAGDYFNQDNGSTLFTHQVLNDGRIMVSIQRSQSDVVMGDAVLLSLKVKPLQSGKLSIQVNSASPMGLETLPGAKLPPVVAVDAE